MSQVNYKTLDFYGFVDLAKAWLRNYPPEVFDGSSGDPGPIFVCAIRQGVEELERLTKEKDIK